MLFEEFYKQKLLKESINVVPRKDLGMSTSILDLPDRKPYGFWVDRSGNFLEVGLQDHIGGLVKILNKAKMFLHNQGIEYVPKYTYRELLDQGWMRVVLGYSNVMYEMFPRQVMTPSQQKFLTILKEQYELDGIVNDT